MMNKKLLFLSLVLGIGLLSCQDKIGDDNVNEDGLVDVTLTTDSYEFIKSSNPKSLVGSGGFTTWALGDIVYVVDANGVPRPFVNTSYNDASSTEFSGKLLANHDKRMYYAYHSALKSSCELNGKILTVSREDLAYELDDETKALRKGDYCSMVAIPLKFDAENPQESKNFDFYHINSLIEARVYPDNDGVLDNLVFDKVIFTMTAIDANKNKPEYNDMTPFNTQVDVNMKIIEPKPVVIHYTDGDKKVGKMSSTITYPNPVKFSDRYTTLGSSKYYDIPIYALPTKALFNCQFDIIFYNGMEKVCHFQAETEFDGLELAGLNDPNFFYPKHSVVEP